MMTTGMHQSLTESGPPEGAGVDGSFLPSNVSRQVTQITQGPLSPLLGRMDVAMEPTKTTKHITRASTSESVDDENWYPHQMERGLLNRRAVTRREPTWEEEDAGVLSASEIAVSILCRQLFR